MLKYTLKRILQAIPLLIIISILTYLIINLAPGDPTAFFINPEKASRLGPDYVANIKHHLGLDQPLYIRYFKWLGNVLRGDFGESFFEQRSVMSILWEALPNTIILSLVAEIIALIVAIPAGIICALKRNSIWDYIFSTISFIGMSLPTFWFGLMLILVFSLKLGWLPTAGMRENFDAFVFTDRLRHIILPAIVLGMGGMAANMRYMRGAMLEVIRQDYVRTARSKGLSEKVVIVKHALRNALIPIVTMLGFSIPGLFSGAAITETIFAWPGVGRIAIEAVFANDYPLVMGNFMIIAVMTVVGSLVADLLYAVVDPRIKYE